MCTQMSKDEGLCQFFLKMNFVVLVLTCFCHLRRIVKTELPAVTTPFTIPNRRWQGGVGIFKKTSESIKLAHCGFKRRKGLFKLDFKKRFRGGVEDQDVDVDKQANDEDDDHLEVEPEHSEGGVVGEGGSGTKEKPICEVQPFNPLMKMMMTAMHGWWW